MATLLQCNGCEGFLPLYRERSGRPDGSRGVSRPLFPGYLFCRLPKKDRCRVLQMPGVRGVVGFGACPAPIEEGEILAIQAILGSGLGAAPWPRLCAGDRVRLDRGPLRGLEGVLCQVGKGHRLVVAVTLLHRSVSVEIERQWVTLLHPLGNFGAGFYRGRFRARAMGQTR